MKSSLEESLGITFEGQKGDHFFRSTLVQTLFYGIFSAWVLWRRSIQKDGVPQVSHLRPGSNHLESIPFNWRLADDFLHVPILRKLFREVSDRRTLNSIQIAEILDLAGGVLNRVQPSLFDVFRVEEAVAYFYEPFLEAFDPALRKELGVWYTPREIVHYMVERVDHLLRTELAQPLGLASTAVRILDPCCGTGAYLTAVLQRIHRTLQQQAGDDDWQVPDKLRTAALTRVFGFEIMPAPFVIAHMELSRLLEEAGAPLTGEQQRAQIFLTNALTGWEPSQHPKVIFEEMEKEREAAEEVKQQGTILVILGNPPYNGYAGIASIEEERGLTTAYRAGVAGLPAPQGQGLNDLYIRFFRIAERRIAQNPEGQGIVSFISNNAWLDGLSHTSMRSHFLHTFQQLFIDNLNGDKYRTGKQTPEGKPDPSAFSTRTNREGIQVGTAIATLVRQTAEVDLSLTRNTRHPSQSEGPLYPARTNTQTVPASASSPPDALGRSTKTTIPPSAASAHLPSTAFAYLEKSSIHPPAESAEGAALYQPGAEPQVTTPPANPSAESAVYAPSIHLRDLWGAAKLSHLERESRRELDPTYHQLTPNPALGLPFAQRIVSAAYTSWPSLPDLFPVSFPGIKTSRDQLLVDIDRDRLESRMRRYFDPNLSNELMKLESPSALESTSRFVASETRRGLALKSFRQWQILRYNYRPFDLRWLYWEPTTKLLDEKREDYVAGPVTRTAFVIAQKSRTGYKPPQITTSLYDLNATDGGANVYRLTEYTESLIDGFQERENLTAGTIKFARKFGTPPTNLFFHALAIMHTPQYRLENAGALLGDWPRIPLPATAPLLEHSAQLGRRLTNLLDPESAAELSPEFTFLAALKLPTSRVGAASDLNELLKLTAGWGARGQGSTVMPGRGRLAERSWTPAERTRLQTLAAAQSLSLQQTETLLGDTCFDIFLNKPSNDDQSVFWSAVPANVWTYTLGGYQVLKKWLSYREHPLLGRPLKPDEAAWFSEVVRRITAILLLGPALDASYQTILPTATGLTA